MSDYTPAEFEECEHAPEFRRMTEWRTAEFTGETYRAVWCHACGDEIEIQIRYDI